MQGWEFEGLDELERDVARLADEVEDRALEVLASFTAAEVDTISAAAARSGRVARMAARSVQARKGGDGAELLAGGSGRLPTGTGTYGDVFWGAEFGGGRRPSTRQFPDYRAEGRWFFPTLEADTDDQLPGEVDDEIGDVVRRVWG